MLNQIDNLHVIKLIMHLNKKWRQIVHIKNSKNRMNEVTFSLIKKCSRKKCIIFHSKYHIIKSKTSYF